MYLAPDNSSEGVEWWYYSLLLTIVFWTCFLVWDTVLGPLECGQGKISIRALQNLKVKPIYLGDVYVFLNGTASPYHRKTAGEIVHFCPYLNI